MSEMSGHSSDPASRSTDFPDSANPRNSFRPAGYLRASVAGVLFVALLFGGVPQERLFAQSQQKPQQQTQQGDQQKPLSVPSAPGGQKPQDQFTLNIEVPLVTVDVVVSDDKGNPITGLKRGNFKVTEDGVAQPVTNFSTPDAPITCVLLIEFSKRGFGIFANNAKIWGDEFLRQLKKDDWIALVSFDIRTHIEVDFTQDKVAVDSYLSRMVFPGFSESNLWDAIIDTLDNLKDVKGRKAIVLLASGTDTLSKHIWDDAYKRVKDTDVTIFPIGVGAMLENLREGRNSIGPIGRLDYQMAQNQMTEIAKVTGGHAFFPVFDGEIPGVMREIAAMLRSQYSLGYSPANQARDGKFRKIKVDLVGEDGAPLEVKDQKGKKLKLVVYNRQGYVAPKGGPAS
jgi:VWFA-related protein